ncbi:MAG: NAD-dependent epimerase/dehydratase family protein [Patescibacteria group bacterium]
MKLLVTGGAGFIGSTLAAQLIKEGHEVVVIDNFNQYYDVELKRARVAALLPQVTVEEIDIADIEALRSLCTRHSFDVVCHLAGQAGVRYSIEAPASYIEANVLGTQTLFEVMRETGIKRMVFASTSSAYGTTTPAPFKETEAADKPVSVYAATKRAAEMIAHTYYHQYQIETTCLRFFTVYGPWSRPDMAMLKFADAIMKGEPIDVYNEGKLRRDFTYVDDIVRGFIAAVHTPLGYEIINLGNGKPVELLNFITQLEEVLGKTTTKRMLPMQPGDVFETYADTTKAKELLGFTAQTDFKTGIANFAQWFLEYRAVKG